VLVVDDSSPDGTGDLADALAADTSGWRCCTARRRTDRPRYLAGFRHALDAGAGYVMEMDSDFSHDPRTRAAARAVRAGADVALGSRYVPGGGVEEWGLLRRFISQGGSTYARLVLG